MIHSQEKPEQFADVTKHSHLRAAHYKQSFTAGLRAVHGEGGPCIIAYLANEYLEYIYFSSWSSFASLNLPLHSTFSRPLSRQLYNNHKYTKWILHLATSRLGSGKRLSEAEVKTSQCHWLFYVLTMYCSQGQHVNKYKLKWYWYTGAAKRN